ncbi:hypothetical protein [Ruegeria sp. B32]|uniref:hypothetical protein n=1 Tax=Ruegeria sp. B32 TaxID=2867020 RepID=UPI0021A2EEFF|nr:hypothetical protein [Ruegeria sp. B32]UWR07652.1 hypothetical protein K3752_01435 [Ruegeria sp. B32]
MTDAEIQEKVDWACDEDWEDLRNGGVDLADTSSYSTTHRLFFALEEQELRKTMTGHEATERLERLKKLAGNQAG